jgi:ubiquinone/menaquinone biosynthesis C-methylase UbiE
VTRDPSTWSATLAYELRSGRWSRIAAKELVRWLNVLDPFDWLDVGCGTGPLLSAILEWDTARRIVGLDRSKESLDAARIAFGDRVELLAGDAERLPFRASEFNLVVSALLFNLVEDPARVLKEMIRVTCHAGVVAAYVWDFAGGMEMMRRFWDAAIALDPRAASFDQAKKSKVADPPSLAALFEGAGLTAVEHRTLDFPTVFSDFADYWDPLVTGKGSIPDYARSIGQAQLQDLRASLEASLPRSEDGRITLMGRAAASCGRVIDPALRAEAIVL